jgi:PPOX class probable F420-dependent enzyme
MRKNELLEEIEFLEGGNYLSLATRKKSGEFVATPVWFAPAPEGYYLFSAGQAGKVKRLRNFSQARIAACTVTGTLTGDWLDTEAFLLDTAEDEEKALQALRRKYGLLMFIGDCFARLTGKMQRRRYIRVNRPAVPRGR